MNKYQLRQWPLSVAVSSVLAAGSLQAATITVDSALDGPVGTYPAACTLRAAIEAANTGLAVDGCIAGQDGLDMVVFDPALVNSTITIASPDTPFEIRGSLVIGGPVPGDYGGLIVDGNGVSRVFDIEGTVDGNIDVLLDSLTITGGHTTELGGGVFSSLADLTITHSLVSSNYSSLGWAGIGAFAGLIALENTVVSYNATGPMASGGGIGVNEADLSVEGGSISNNLADHFGGGGLVAQGYSTVTLTDTIVSGNEIATGTGAGILAGYSELSVYRSQIRDNRVSGNFGFGAGLGAYSSLVTLIDSEVSMNQLYSDQPGAGYGGGIGVAHSSLLVAGSTISGNRVNNYGNAMGGGIFARSSDTVVRNSRVSENQAIRLASFVSDFVGGGGLYLQTGTTVISEAEISSNVAQGLYQRGGAIGALAEDLALTNVTISGNQLDGAIDTSEGVGFVMDLRGQGNLTLTHVTMANNLASSSSTDQSALFRSQMTDLTLTNVLLSNASSDSICNRPADVASASLVTDDSCTGTSADAASLALLPLADNGGFTQTHALQRSSIALDVAGDCSTLGVLVDQRGIPRDPKCDVGAFEFPELLFEDRFEVLSPP
ncbi:right-handed parallel beta-helix repeat-containing protein [Wenzhouxiangella marina]|uniref:Right handed beta helix domain-containing protein n=1 Tax=Wenzhouxiangella marina TaxID=1579979 RepID=A0A0K0XZT1_9GAMM|nr:right-handed parallel beta-helix repeat-containing protein [Wenzhouxiangella marina]AKS43189.1 hypothetical protein WM2015_2832 [Wenzhouxiangella marina]MBB6087126.1 CSLREA domain-containing protein [Wenzhouxiangella marina]